jgi:hypothetical protein
MWLWTVPDHSGGPHRSIDAVAEIPIESASSGSTGSIRDTNTVSFRMVLARQATRSSRAARLVFQRTPSAAPASRLKRKAALGRLITLSLWAASGIEDTAKRRSTVDQECHLTSVA